MLERLLFFTLFFLLSTFLTAQEVSIGDQAWMDGNLNVSYFKNGDKIPQAETIEAWINANSNQEPAWCYYNNDSTTGVRYGKLYNRYALQDPRGLAPEGWRVPTAQDFREMAIYYQNNGIEMSVTDTTNYRSEMNKIKEGFEQTSNDSLYASEFREAIDQNEPIREIVPTIGDLEHSVSTCSESVILILENTPQGEVIGPFINDDEISLFKVVENRPVEYATVRHILLSVSAEEDRTPYLKRADSLIAAIKAQDNFEEMVVEFSDDPGSINRGGVYEHFTRGIMVKNFNDFSFENSPGTIGKVESDFGIHIVEVLNRKTESRPIVIPISKIMRKTNELSYYLARSDLNGIKGQKIKDVPNFDAPLSGFRTHQGMFVGMGKQTVLWAAGIGREGQLAFFSIVYGVDVSVNQTDYEMGFSVRCIRE